MSHERQYYGKGLLTPAQRLRYGSVIGNSLSRKLNQSKREYRESKDGCGNDR